MNRSLLMVALLGLVVAGLVLVFWMQQGKPASSATVNLADSTATPQPPLEKTDSAEREEILEGARADSPADDQRPDISSALPQSALLQEEMLSGASDEDRRWMRDHGFSPESSDYTWYTGLDDSEVEQLASTDLQAKREWCFRLLHKFKLGATALDCFVEAAARGSHAAMELLGQTYMGLQGAPNVQPDPLMAQAWFRASYRLGNWAALLWAHAMNANEPLTPRELFLADALAASIVADLDERHRALTGQPFPIVPRPGYEQAIQNFLERGFDNADEEGPATESR